MNRSHLLLVWLGQLLSGIGDRLHLVALMWIAVDAVGEQAGFVAAAGPAAQLVLGLFGGVFADRLDKRKLMLAADLGRAAAVATLAVAAWHATPTLWHLAAVGFVLGALDGLFQPALRASLPLLAPERATLQRANAWFEMTQRLAAVLGPPLTGVLLGVMSIGQFFAVDAASFAASALAIATLGRGYAWRATPKTTSEEISKTRPGTVRPDRPDAFREIRGAVRLVAANRPVRWSLLLTAIWNLGSASAMTVGLPLLARDVLGAGPALYGYLVGAYGVGNVASNLLLVWRPPVHPLPWLFGGGFVWGVGMVGVALAPNAPLALLGCAFAALGGPMTDVVRAFLLQTEFPADQIGKVYSLRVTTAKATAGIGLLLAAPIFAMLGVRGAIAAGGAIVAIAHAVAFLRVNERDLHASDAGSPRNTSS